ncbi:MAG: YmdB family metallophosphoesterase [Ignavibacteria bacterium]|nr:YmdB family metallophosphoesterase [Ignavibacteria bacterium]
MNVRNHDNISCRSCNTDLINNPGNEMQNSDPFIFAFNRESTVQGTYTHFRTSVNRISETEKAHITNAGITGPYNSLFIAKHNLAEDGFYTHPQVNTGLPIRVQEIREPLQKQLQVQERSDKRMNFATVF